MPRRILTAVFLAALGALAALKMAKGADNDLFWQLKDGERIVREHVWPVQEEFSFTAQGRSMVAIEWGAEAISYLVYRLGGYEALLAMSTAQFLAVFLLLLALARRRLPLLESLGLLSLAAFGFLNFYAVRAQNWTFLFTALFLYWATLWEDGAGWAPWAMAGVMPFWANLHGGFMLGLGILGLLCLRRLREGRRLAALGPLGLGALLCCAHPNGVTGAIYPLWFMAAPPPGRSLVLEWRPVDFADKTASPYLLILGLLIWLGAYQEGRRFPWAFLTVLLTVLALRGRKLLPELDMAAVAALAPKVGRKPARWVLAAAAVLALTVSFCVVLSPPRPSLDLERGYPKAAAELIGSRFAGRRLFHDYDWGGYLIFKLYPSTKVFIDGRLDPYWRLLSGDYYSLLEARPGWQRLLEDYGITLALLRPSDRLAAELAQDPAWQMVYADERAALLARKEKP